MKILHVMAGAPNGIAETMFLESVIALHDAGLDQFVVTRHNDAFRLRNFSERRIPFLTPTFNRWWRWPTDKMLRNAIERFRPDVFHFWGEDAASFAKPAYRNRSIGWHGSFAKLTRFANCGLQVATSPAIAAHIRRANGGQDVALLRGFSEFPFAKPVPRSLLNTPDEAPLFLVMDALVPGRGLDMLVHALAKVPEAHLWIAGDGPLKPQMKAQARLLNVRKRMTFLGWHNDRGALLAASDAVLAPTPDAALEATWIDAWAAGRPLIAAAGRDNGAMTHEENALVVATRSADGFAATMNRLIQDPALYHGLVSGGNRTYQDLFTKSAFVDNATALYERMLTDTVSAPETAPSQPVKAEDTAAEPSGVGQPQTVGTGGA